MKSNSMRRILMFLGLVLVITGVVWYIEVGGYEPFYAVVSGLVSFLGSFLIRDKSSSSSVDVSGNRMQGKRNKIQVERDGVKITKNKMKDSDAEIIVKHSDKD